MTYPKWRAEYLPYKFGTLGVLHIGIVQVTKEGPKRSKVLSCAATGNCVEVPTASLFDTPEACIAAIRAPVLAHVAALRARANELEAAVDP